MRCWSYEGMYCVWHSQTELVTCYTHNTITYHYIFCIFQYTQLYTFLGHLTEVSKVNINKEAQCLAYIWYQFHSNSIGCHNYTNGLIIFISFA